MNPKPILRNIAGDGDGVIPNQSSATIACRSLATEISLPTAPAVIGAGISETATESVSVDATTIRSQVNASKRKYTSPKPALTAEQVDQLRRNPPPYTTLPEIAVVLQVSQRTVMRYVEDRRISAMNRGKHALLFNTRKVLEALERCS